MSTPQGPSQSDKPKASKLGEKAEDMIKNAGQGFDPQRRREIISEVFSVWVGARRQARHFYACSALGRFGR